MRSARCNAALFEDWHDLQAIARPEVTRRLLKSSVRRL